MLTGLSLRLRIFLFFCLLAPGGVAISATALWITYSRAGNPGLLNDFVFAEILIGFGFLALVAGFGCCSTTTSPNRSNGFPPSCVPVHMPV